MGCASHDIVLDFFAGSASTGQAIFENAVKKGINRNFILVQLPETIDDKSAAYKAGYKLISEIAIARLRKVIDQNNYKGEDSVDLFKVQDLNLGFKIFRLKHSNFKLWRGDVIENGDDLTKQIDVFENPVKAGTVEENILYELLLKSGYELTAIIEKRDDIYFVNNEFALALTEIDDATIKEILALKPKKCLILDKLFNNNDELKTNTVLQMRDAGIEFKTV